MILFCTECGIKVKRKRFLSKIYCTHCAKERRRVDSKKQWQKTKAMLQKIRDSYLKN